ncbi:MAG: tetratricopeptide repeat protein, partial [Pseudomonadota bacterium]
ELAPQEADLLNLRGISHRRTGAPERAIRDYTRALEQDPVSDLYLRNRAAARIDAGQFDQALTDIEDALVLNPNNGEAYNILGDLHHAQDQLESAEAAYLAGLEVAPFHALLYIGLSNIEMDRKNPRRAITYLDQVLKLAPGHAVAYRKRAVAKATLGDRNAALEDTNAALRIDPDLADAYADRGVIYLLSDLPELAIRDLNAAIERAPENGNTWYNRGRARLKLNDPAAAASDLETALRLAPDHVQAFLSLADARKNLGEPQAALAALEGAIAAGGAPVVSMLQAYLKSSLRGYGGAETGVYDAATRDALIACLNTPSC